MTEQDILDLISRDEWMMSVLKVAEELNLPDWIIGAGFVRNKVWNHLHNYYGSVLDTDIDLAYFDPYGNDQESDESLSLQVKERTGFNFEIVNQAYAHKWNGHPPYKSAEDALSRWVETATSVGVTMKDGSLKLIAPNGTEDLVNLVIRPTPAYIDKMDQVLQRVESKNWLSRWPKLRVEN